MKMTHKDINMQIELDYLHGTELIIESEKLFYKYIYELRNGENGADCDFVISDDDKIISVNKCMHVMLEPISLDLNQKSFISKLYAKLSKEAYNEKNFLDTQNIASKIKEYITNLDFDSDIMLDVEDEIDVNSIFKASGVKIYAYSDDILGNIVNYIKLSNNLLGKTIFVFVNFRSYLSKAEITKLIYELSYYNIYILFIEGSENDCIPDMKRYIIDKDNCEI